LGRTGQNPRCLDALRRPKRVVSGGSMAQGLLPVINETPLFPSDADFNQK